MSDDTQKPTAASTLRDAIATLERVSSNLRHGAGDSRSGWTFGYESCRYIANAIDLVLDTQSLLTSVIREHAASESIVMSLIDSEESKLVAMAIRVEHLKRVFELGILRKE
jgi:hypothetical protein